MAEIRISYNQTVNFETLDMSLRSQFENLFYGLEGDENAVRVVCEDTINTTLLDAAMAAHDPNALTPKQEKEQARAAIILGKDYLQDALLEQSPSIGTIYTTIKARVDSNTYLSRAVTNQIDLMRLAYGWGVLNLLTPTNIDRARYIAAAKDVIAQFE